MAVKDNRATFKPNVLCKKGPVEEIHSRLMVIAKNGQLSELLKSFKYLQFYCKLKHKSLCKKATYYQCFYLVCWFWLGYS